MEEEIIEIIDFKEENHNDFLFYCRKNDYHNCKKLLEINPRLVHCKNENDANGLFLLLTNYNIIPNIELIQLLIKNNIDYVCKTKNKSSILFSLIIGLSDLDYSNKYVEILLILIKFGVDIYELDQTDESTTFIDFCESILQPEIIENIKEKYYMKKMEQ